MAAPTLRILAVVCILGAFAAAASGSSGRFLGTREGHLGQLGRRGPADLLAELEGLESVLELNHTMVTSARVDRLEEALLPLFRLAPKDADGRLDAKAARYALHRLFVLRHAWHVNGIELHGAVRNSSKIGTALDNGGRFSLRQLAHFAATLETLVHVENMERLQRVFDELRLPKNSSMDDKMAQTVIEGYMALYVASFLPANASMRRAVRELENRYPSWDDTKVFVEEVRQTTFERNNVKESASMWASCLHVVEEIGERYGRWQNKDCILLKDALMSVETPGTGRVPLSSFWGMSWYFDESLPYLEQLGALEGSEAPHHSVVIPNYIYSSANCLAGSKYYDVCCLSECESLLEEIEARVATSTATPQRLVEVVESLPSSTVSAPRDLSASLKQRLDDIAAYHGGSVVQLHGRLFAQFMHHAYPRECPYPHLSISNGSSLSEQKIKPMSPESRASRKTKAAYMSSTGAVSNGSIHSFIEIPWTDEEDLFMRSIGFGEREGSDIALEPSMGVRRLAMLLVLCAMASALRRPLTKVPFPAGKCLSNRYFV